jgi:hypothetical protein
MLPFHAPAPPAFVSWSSFLLLGLLFTEEHRLRVFENRVTRRIFGPRRDEVTGGWRKLHNDEHHNLHSSPSIIKMLKPRIIRWPRYVARMGRRGMHTGY